MWPISLKLLREFWFAISSIYKPGVYSNRVPSQKGPNCTERLTNATFCEQQKATVLTTMVFFSYATNNAICASLGTFENSSMKQNF